MIGLNLQASLVENYEVVWPEDPALDKELSDFDHRWEQATDGMLPWHSCCKADALPTIFVLRNFPGSKKRALFDLYRSEYERRPAQTSALIARLALVDIKNEPGLPQVKLSHHEIGPIVDEAVANAIDSAHEGILTYIGAEAMRRMSASPKR